MLEWNEGFEEDEKKCKRNIACWCSQRGNFQEAFCDFDDISFITLHPLHWTSSFQRANASFYGSLSAWHLLLWKMYGNDSHGKWKPSFLGRRPLRSLESNLGNSFFLFTSSYLTPEEKCFRITRQGSSEDWDVSLLIFRDLWGLVEWRCHKSYNIFSTFSSNFSKPLKWKFKWT